MGPNNTRMGARLVGATISMHTPSSTLSQPFPNIALTHFGHTTRGQKKKITKGGVSMGDKRGHQWFPCSPRDDIMNATRFRPMVSIGIPIVGTRLNRFGAQQTMINNPIIVRARLMN